MVKSKKPLVSVVMPVRNAGDFLCLSVSSILKQTYCNFELLVVDDASTDGSLGVLKSFHDKRIRIIRNKRNLGITKSANLAIKRAKGEFIARMDGDDIALPNRLEKQVNFLLKNKGVVAVGGQCDLIDSDGKKVGEKRFPNDFESIKRMIFRSVPVQQPSIMVAVCRLPRNFVWYNETFKTAEELELLFKLFNYGEVRNLRSKVLLYRIHKGNTSLKDPKNTFYLTLKTRLIAVRDLGYKPTLFGVVSTIVQAIVVFVLPERLIYPLYSYLRGMRKIHVKLNMNVNFIFKKAFALVKV